MTNTESLLKSLEPIKNENKEYYDELVNLYSKYSNFDSLSFDEYVEKVFSSEKRAYFTICSKETFNSLSTYKNWINSIIYTPLNDHSRPFMKKGDIVFCYRQGQFSELKEALQMRGIYALGFVASEPKILFPNKEDHNKYGVAILFPFGMKSHLELRNIQLNPVTISLTPYNGNRNDALQYIPQKEYYTSLLEQICRKNPYLRKSLNIVLDYEIDDKPLADEIWNKENIKQISSISLPLNRIIFGAPGTGKSHRLEEERKQFFNEESTSKNLTDEERIKQEIKQAGNDYSVCFAVGLKYADVLKNVKQANELISKYGSVNKYAAYRIFQGIRAKQVYKDLSNFDESELTIDKIKEQVEKIDKEKYLLQASCGAIGYKYSDFLSGFSIAELKEQFGFKNTTSESYWINLGIHAADYSFDDNSTQKSTKPYERVTFHPNYSYSQFVGCYKPSVKNVSIDDGEKEEITYSFVPGPFLRVYVNAIKNSAENFLLLIEEINRANVAAVFGDVFQLLDRKEGKSEYPVTASEDIIKYLRSEGINKTELSIPENMYIWATMNSADQGVFPMDTAFKRRWNFEYIGINDNENGVSTYEIPINKNKKVNWNDLRKAINSKLISLNVNEDKLLGPYFISENDLKNAMGKPEDFIKLFKSKVLMYLFEDAAKMKRDFFKLTDNRKYIYSDICNELDENGIAVFNFLENEKVEEKDIPEKVQNDGEKIVGSSPTMTEKTKIESSVSSQNDGTN